METIFDDLTFDLGKFLSYPKCKATWLIMPNGARCLFNAFFSAFGFSFSDRNCEVYFEHPVSGILRTTGQMINEINIFAEVLGMDNFSPWTIIFLYDHGLGDAAVKELWELIERLPNKTGYCKMDQVREQVCLLKGEK